MAQNLFKLSRTDTVVIQSHDSGSQRFDNEIIFRILV